MNDSDIVKILTIISSCLKNDKPLWHLAGSANLRVQGIDVSVRDLDITASIESMVIFRKALSDYIVSDFFNEKIQSDSLVCDINGFEVEINSYRDIRLLMLDKTKCISWSKLQVPVLPLVYAKQFYEIIKRESKVKLIEEYLKE